MLLLLLSTPVTLVGALYLFGACLTTGGMITVPWWKRRSAALILAGGTVILVTILVRVMFPPSGSGLVIDTLPGRTGPRWLNRIFNEQDIVLFGARVAPFIGAVSPGEADSLVPTLEQAFDEMHHQEATPLSPFLTTYLNQQQSDGYDAVISEPDLDSPVKSGIIFLHGFGGNFTLQCWLVAQIGDRTGAVTVCPSTRPFGDWWSPQGEAILRETLGYLQERGIERIYLAGLSNGGIGVSRLAQRYGNQLAGLILISGADPSAPITTLPVLVVHGEGDERIPDEIAERYVDAVGSVGRYLLFEGDHFLLLKQADQVQKAIEDWLIEQDN
ncbi:MAG: alpha/beta hydrolase [Chloroflexota bacterium]|nr:MAG: alpha/beta hydrolase [Chloroflexota bacterium]